MILLEIICWATAFTSGKAFSNSSEFKKLVVEQEKTFIRCLAKKMMTYAIGRKLNSGDRPSIDRISKMTIDDQAGLQELVQFIVQSKSFLEN